MWVSRRIKTRAVEQDLLKTKARAAGPCMEERSFSSFLRQKVETHT